jgi:hypothetical protein
MMAECYYRLSDFQNLAKLVASVPVGATTGFTTSGGTKGSGGSGCGGCSSGGGSGVGGSGSAGCGGGGGEDDESGGGGSLLLELAARLESVGMHDAAVEAYLKAGEARKAIDCAVLLNQWSRAVELAEEFEFPQVQDGEGWVVVG